MMMYFLPKYIPTVGIKEELPMSSTKHFSKDFILVVIGQIISLFGNSVLRFVLPLHLLNITGSAALYGFVSAFSFIPMLVMSPIGGVVADRINKRNIMVGLDFFTGGIIAIFFLVYQHRNKGKSGHKSI